MKNLFMVLVILPLAGCATALQDRERCGNLVDAAWQELDAAKVEGFAGTISYAKAAGLLARAKANQAVEDFADCIDTAGRARFFIAESRKGR
jgi:hypothetical protein